MEEVMVLQVVLHGEEGLEIRLGNEKKVNPLVLVGILEQVKLNILSGGSDLVHMDDEAPRTQGDA